MCEKIGVRKMCENVQMGRSMYNELMSGCHWSRVIQKAQKIDSKQKIHKFVAFLTGVEGRLNVNQAAKNTLVQTKIWALNRISFSQAEKQGTYSP